MSWRDRAACFGMDINIFFPERGDRAGIAAARAVCAACPVSDECLTEILHVDSGTDYVGIFAGTSAQERRELRRHLGLTSTARSA